METIVRLRGNPVIGDGPAIAHIAAEAPLRNAQGTAVIVHGVAVEHLVGEVAFDETGILRDREPGERPPFQFDLAPGETRIRVDEFTDIRLGKRVENLAKNLLTLVPVLER